MKQPLRAGAAVTEPNILDFGHLSASSDQETNTHHIDCDTAIYGVVEPVPADRSPKKSSAIGTFLPILFSPWDKPNLSDSLPCVSVRSRCRRPPEYWQTPEH